MDKNFVLMCAAVLLFALVTLVWQDDGVSTGDGEGASLAATIAGRQPSPSPAPTHERDPAVAVAPTSVETESAIDADLLAHVEHKYRYLLADSSANGLDVAALRQHLLKRESDSLELQALRNAGSRSDTIEALMTQVAGIDAEIASMLPAIAAASYAALKDSDSEQHHLGEYTGGLSNVAPLSDEQERTVLEARLRHKQRYETVLRDAGLDRDGLSLAERDYAHEIVARALKQYRDDFLIDVAASLSQEQLTLLTSYEATEFTRELERLQRTINAK